jgi:hypothetical protein
MVTWIWIAHFSLTIHHVAGGIGDGELWLLVQRLAKIWKIIFW